MAEKPGNWQNELDRLSQIAFEDYKLTEFESFQSDQKRMNYIMSNGYIDTVSWISSYFDNCQQLHRKSSEKSEFFRKVGNDFFQHKCYEEALEKYTQAILFSPMEIGSFKQQALGYSNRSAVFFHLSNFQECVKDIDLAFNCGFEFPIGRVHKLYMRRASSYIKLTEKEKAFNDLLSIKQILDDNLELCQSKKDVMNKEIDALEAKLRMSPIVVLKETREESEDSQSSKPSYGQNSVLMQASNAIQMEYSHEKGRYLVANRSLCAGDIVIVERPFAAVLLPDHYKEHCHHCFRTLTAAQPCHHCCVVRFCSDHCQKEAWNLYHKIECPYLDLLHSVGIAHLSLRIVLVAGLQYLIDFQSKVEANNSEDGSFGLTDDGRYETSYNAVYHLMPHSEDMEVQDIFQYSLTAGLLLKILQHSGWLKSLNKKCVDSSLLQNSTKCVDDLNKETGYSSVYQTFSKNPYGIKWYEEEICIGGLLLRHIQQLVCNAHAITKVLVAGDSGDVLVDVQNQVIVATAVYPTASLMNHSCDPTIISSFQKDALIVRTVKDVLPGEEIFNCYGPHHSRMLKSERHQVLKSQYFFNCTCQFCCQDDDKNNSSAFRCPGCNGPAILTTSLSCKVCMHNANGELEREKAAASQQLFVEGLTMLQNGDVEAAVEKILKCYKLRTEIFYKHNSHLSETQDCLARCYAMLGQYKKSAKFLRQSIETVAVTYGEMSVELANELHKFAEVLVNAEELVEASSVNDRAVEILTVLYGPSNSSVIELKQLKQQIIEFRK